MKKTYYNFLLFGLALVCTSCAKQPKVTGNEDEKRFFDAWISVNYPDVAPTGDGIYVIEETQGEGQPIADSAYLFVTYTFTDLYGNVSATSDPAVAQRIGTYVKSDYYGPNVWLNNEYANTVALTQMLDGMKIGGSKTAVIPGWLLSMERYSSTEEYLSNVTGNENMIYKVHITGATDDISKWQIRNLEKFSEEWLEGADSTSYGFYYKRLAEPINEKDFPSDTTFYINYTGRLLNGQVFDTTIADTAKVHNIYNASKTYAPVKITWSNGGETISLGSSSDIVKGFSQTIKQMHDKEKGVGIFYSELGYGRSSSSKKIPSYASLIFEIEITEEK